MKLLLIIMLATFSLTTNAKQTEALDISNISKEEKKSENIDSIDNQQYYLKVVNKKLHTRVVYVEGQKVGEVKGSSEKVFLLSTKCYRLIELKEKAITLSPKTESFIIQNRPNDGEIVEIVNNTK
ncbi:MAG: hypothetical protein IJ609_04010 [Paludibacteraceae bacterium]|nr:hypothetical protein [Paludibacteraceae bacterium]MBR1878379.1 hypothetical protein [Paludibacteraceae bacterium]